MAPLVVKLGGAAMESAGEGSAVWSALAALAAQERGGLVLVHGGGAEVDRRLGRLGVVSEKRAGVRITPEEQIDEVVAALAGVMSRRVTGALLARGVRAVGLSLADGGLAVAAKAAHYGFDAGRVGVVNSGDGAVLHALLRAGFTPVINPIAADAEGRALNVNADDAAAAVAGIIGARALVLLTDVPGVLDESGAVIASLTAEDVEARIAGGAISGGMVVKARGAVRAAEDAGAPAAIAPADDIEGLLRFARGGRFGTLVMPPEPGVEPAVSLRRRRLSGEPV